MTEREELLLETLEDVVCQACLHEGVVDSMALSAYAGAIRILAEYGFLEIEVSVGRRVIAHIVQRTPQVGKGREIQTMASLGERIKYLLKLAGQLPEGIESDWRGTNHFELHAPYSREPYFWLDFQDLATLNSEEEEGQRVGLVLDIVEALKKAEAELKQLITIGDKGGETS